MYSRSFDYDKKHCVAITKEKKEHFAPVFGGISYMFEHLNNPEIPAAAYFSKWCTTWNIEKKGPRIQTDQDKDVIFWETRSTSLKILLFNYKSISMVCIRGTEHHFKSPLSLSKQKSLQWDKQKLLCTIHFCFECITVNSSFYQK